MLTIQVRLTKELVNKAQELVDEGLYSNKSEVIRDSLRRLAFERVLLTKNERSYKVLYTADIHGNIVQYKKLFKKASEEKADAIIIGGDIAPKDSNRRTIQSQKDFFQNELFPLIKEFKKNNKAEIFIMMGNDDFKSNEIFLKRQNNMFKLIDNKTMKFHEDFKIVGYPFVPLTPFKYKDWEKLDANDEDEYIMRKGISLEGIKTRGNRFFNVKFDLKNRVDTIENNLNKIFKRLNPAKTVFVSHSPPYNTCLDIIKNKEHVGSIAIKKLIEEKQPYLTLHGHIHEATEISNNFMEKNKNTTSMSPGNNYLTDTLALIEFNLYKPQEAKRLVI